MEVHQVHGVAGETGSAVALPLDEESILGAYKRNLSETVRNLPDAPSKQLTGNLPDEVSRDVGHFDGMGREQARR